MASEPPTAAAFYEARLQRGLEADAVALRTAANRKVILAEEDYVDATEAIITRDFFPDLPKLRAQLEYMEALESKDERRIASVRARLSAMATPASSTPRAASRTPMLDSRGTTPTSAAARDGCAARADASEGVAAPPHGLDCFLARHTSEDNASFAEIYGRMRAARQERLWWMDRSKHDSRLLLEHPEAAAVTDERARAAEVAGGEGVLTVVGDARPTNLNEPKPPPTTNALFWPAEGMAAPPPTMGPPPSIAHRRTRMAADGDALRPARGAAALVAASSAGAARGPAATAAGASGATPIGPDGFAYVASTPALTPGGAGESPLMTWGEIAGTPLLLEPLDVPLFPAGEPSVLDERGPSFKLPKQPRREEVSHQLADRQKKGGGTAAAGSARHGVAKRGAPALGRTSSPALSPAAAKLAARLSRAGAHTPGAPHADMQLRASYARTPTHDGSSARRRSGSTPASAAGGRTPLAGTPLVTHAQGQQRARVEPPSAPSASPSATTARCQQPPPRESITDGLLKL